MNNFLLLFRADFSAAQDATPEQQKQMTESWMQWITQLAESGNLVDRGSSLAGTGKVVKANSVITNGPYTEIKETLGGYTIIKAATYEDAAELVKACPVLYINGSVEIRHINMM